MHLSQTPHTCGNCGKIFEGKFCPECGQKAGVKTATAQYLIESVTNAFDFDRGVVATFWQLTVRPARVTDQFLSGNTSTYSNPVKYFFVAVSVALVHSVLLSYIDQKERADWVTYAKAAWLFCGCMLPNYFLNRGFTSVYGHVMVALYPLSQIIYLNLISASITFLTPKSVSTPISLSAILLAILYIQASSVSIYHLKGRRALLNITVGLLSFLAVTFIFIIVSAYLVRTLRPE